MSWRMRSGTGSGFSIDTRIGTRIGSVLSGTDLKGEAHGTGDAGAGAPMNGRAMLDRNDETLFGTGVF